MHTRPQQEADSGNPHCRCGSWHYLDPPQCSGFADIASVAGGEIRGTTIIVWDELVVFQPAGDAGETTSEDYFSRYALVAVLDAASGFCCFDPISEAGNEVGCMSNQDNRGGLWISEQQTQQWQDLLHKLPSQFPELASLHVAITLGGYVTCFWLSQGTEITGMFCPLRQLRRLGVFTVVINDTQMTNECTQDVHDEKTHASAARYTFFARKEVRRVWAEEIREVVLGGEVESGI